MKLKFTDREKKWLWQILYGLFLLTVCEVGLRIYLVHFAGQYRFDIYSSYDMLEDRYEKHQLTMHSFLGYANSPNYAYGPNVHNSRGFRGAEVTVQKPDSVYRIVCLGGSTTYSSGVDDYTHSYPYLLNEALNKNGLQVEVINAAVEGYTALHSYINYLLKVEDLQPDMLIIYHAVNDLYYTRLVWPPEYYLADQSGAQTPFVQPSLSVFRKLSIFRVPLVYAGFIEPDIVKTNVVNIEETNHILKLREQLSAGIYPSEVFEEVSLDSMIKTNKPVFFEQNLVRLIEKAQSNGTEVVLSTFIYSDQFPEVSPELALTAYQNGLGEHNEITRQLAVKYDLPLLDLEKEMHPDTAYITDGVHFNLLGNQKRVEILTEFLQPIIEASKSQKRDEN